MSAAHGEVHPANDFGVFALAVGIFVGKTHVIESDIIAKCFDVRGMFEFANGILGQENLVDALHRSHPLGNGVRGFGEIFQRLDDAVENHHIKDEGRRINRAVVREDQGAAVPQNEDNQTGAEKFAHRMRRTLPNGHAHIDVAEIISGRVEAALHLFFRAERLDDAHSAQGFF